MEKIETLKVFKPDVVGIQAMCSTFPSAQVVAKICKEHNHNIPVVVGGIHATIQPQQIISDPNIGFVIYGEWEATMVESTKL